MSNDFVLTMGLPTWGPEKKVNTNKVKIMNCRATCPAVKCILSHPTVNNLRKQMLLTLFYLWSLGTKHRPSQLIGVDKLITNPATSLSDAFMKIWYLSWVVVLPQVWNLSWCLLGFQILNSWFNWKIRKS